ITTDMICLTINKFIDKKKKTPGLRKSKATPKEMAKNINSVSITVLLFVLLVASTEILKSEAQTFCFECGPVPFLGTNADCFNCCKTKYGSPPVVSGVVEGISITVLLFVLLVASTEMAKNINSVSITVLLFVLLVASTGTNADCFNCCKTKYGSPPVVSGVVEGIRDMSVCLCSNFFCFPIKHQRAKLITALPQVYAYVAFLHILSLLVAKKILKSEAQTFCFECGPVPFLGTNADCFNCCKTKYGSPPVVSGVVEGSEKHCHCYC
ncbi:hypothetical protein HID58_002622, partial [Brassica napus]